MEDELSKTFAALADPTRRAMLARLSKGEASVTELAKPFLKDMSLPAVTKHLKVLEKAGLITKTRDAQWRPCRLNGERLKDVSDWMEQYRVFWEESLDRLEAYLKTVTSNQKAKGKNHGKK
ncbi:MAG TPA: metalloregulator ArsR/SmtB family transcription factor [Bdellovibrionota bacterium]|jgi:DNA-binding transcriptional ArsR family regulator|nr:metalloregulator ArsR/SmtB family transcription factor [Bdellovibrionota bacterium]